MQIKSLKKKSSFNATNNTNKNLGGKTMKKANNKKNSTSSLFDTIVSNTPRSTKKYNFLNSVDTDKYYVAIVQKHTMDYENMKAKLDFDIFKSENDKWSESRYFTLDGKAFFYYQKVANTLTGGDVNTNFGGILCIVHNEINDGFINLEVDAVLDDATVAKPLIGNQRAIKEYLEELKENAEDDDSEDDSEWEDDDSEEDDVFDDSDEDAEEDE